MNLDDDTPTEEPIALDDAAAEEQPVVETAAEEPTEEVAFTFDGEEGADEPQPDDSPVIRTLREKTREQARRLKELEAKLKADDKPSEIGPEPTLEDCGYDEDEFKRRVKDWTAKQTEAERAEQAKQANIRQQQEAWANRVLTFEEKAKTLVPNYAETAAAVADQFGDDEAGNVAKAILIYADDPRLLAALNSSPAKLAELVAMKNDPTALAIAVGELKGKIRTMPRKSAPPPETITKGGAPVAASVDKELERLEKDADRTGDRSAVIAYKRKLKQNAA